MISQSGPEHAKTFVVEVTWEELMLGQGKGSSKKQAETAAAEVAMEKKLWEKRDRPDRSEASQKKNPRGAMRSRPAAND